MQTHAMLKPSATASAVFALLVLCLGTSVTLPAQPAGTQPRQSGAIALTLPNKAD